ncbi:hypothetical protein [Blastococcus sp. CT_GayMR16]|uniref:hypothetical protein n=1 Tax=Blastococcus sp. CT_GayMR16 TaxID=2559607 RepID=UPI0010736C1D|nr:hypothetical protein [Blastococcus sp. CT_GayMR16]TFV88351.1 hypothetical protein E4P38_11455 [Blastococcus sp. CT_GayMR16]
MGKHDAPAGSGAHPLVADALAHRAPDAHRHDGSAPVREGGLGWPGPPPGEGGVGWPQKGSAARSAGHDVTAPRRGWRRFFGARTAA